jgi:son of sevenless-like protein
VYLRYAENYMEALSHLHTLMEDDDVVKHLESQPTKLFKEAMQYLLPKSLLEPIYHCFYYFEILDVSYLYLSWLAWSLHSSTSSP